MERESGGSHSHTEPSSQKISSSSGKGYGVVAMVMHSLLQSLFSENPVPPLLGRERGGGHDHTEPFSQKISSSSGKGKV